MSFDANEVAVRDVAISVQGLGKRYEIYDRPRDRLMQMLMRGRRQYFREFWALRDVSFEIRRGDAVGIIGRNGSGKSTLLQLVCGTLNPTEGQIQVNGRVAALLELGAGFNPEFSGRDNVYMAAQLLGLTRAQTDERFDRIAAFADIGDFIEQPVKTYSSGMYVRLAFAVNAHVDADILVIDEALAVGDAVFTQKCMRYIRAFRERGTLLFVSHDSSAVQNLCKNAIWLGQGKARASGPAREVCESYFQFTLQEIYGDEAKLHDLALGANTIEQAEPVDSSDTNVAAQTSDGPEEEAAANSSIEFANAGLSIQSSAQAAALAAGGIAEHEARLERARGFTTGSARIESVALLHNNGQPAFSLAGNEPVRLRIQARASEPMAQPILGFLVRDRLGQDLFGENTLPYTDQYPISVQADQSFEAEFAFRLPMLPNGEYSVMCSVADGTLHNHVQHHWLHDALILKVSSARIRYGLVGIPFEDVRLKVNT